LQEILAEVDLRRRQVEDDVHQVLHDLHRHLARFDLSLREERPASAAAALRRLLQRAEREEETPTEVLRILRNSREVMNNLDAHLRLLTEIEQLLLDWLWGLAYHSAREQQPGAPPHTWVL